MHYKNGREVKVGDKVVVPNGNYSFVGAVVETQPGAVSCNLYVVPLRDVQLTTANNCMHLDDAIAWPKPEPQPEPADNEGPATS